MKRFFGAIVVTGMLLGITVSHQILAQTPSGQQTCMCVPTINEIRSNGTVFLAGNVQCVSSDEVVGLLASGSVLLADPTTSTSMPGMCGVCRDADGNEEQCPPFD